MTLAELQRTLDRTLRGELPPDAAAALLGADPRRLAIYARFTRNHAHTALTENLPVFVTRAADRWPALFDAFFAARPPRHWALNHAAEAFPAYIERLAETAPDWPGPFETCLAQFEWTLYTALADPKPIPDPTTLTAPIPNPTLVPISFPYPVADVVLAHRRGEHPPTPAPLPEPAVVLFYQSPTTGNGRFQKANPDLLFALAATAQGLDAPTAAAQTGHPPAAVATAYATAAQLGVIIAPG